MNNINLLRRIVEELDYCSEYDVQDLCNGNMVIYFYYSDPVDSVIWTLDKSYYDANLRSFFVMAKNKLKKNERA